MLKSFEDPEEYDGEIRALVPAHGVLHSMVPELLKVYLDAGHARLLVVGCGPGHEVTALARASEHWTIDAIDSSPGMIDATRRAIDAAGVGARVAVTLSSLLDFVERRSYDAVVALLVGHLMPDDGARRGFFSSVSAALLPGGLAVFAEFVDDGPARSKLNSAHVGWAARAGVPLPELERVSDRLQHRFAALRPERRDDLLREVGLEPRADFFRVFGVVGTIAERSR